MTRKPKASKHERITVSREYGLAIGDVAFEVADAFVGDYVTHDGGKTWARIVRERFYLDGATPEDVIERLQEAQARLSEVQLTLDCDWDNNTSVFIVGEQPTAVEERSVIGRYLAWRETKQAAAKERERATLIERARAFAPDILKDGI